MYTKIKETAEFLSYIFDETPQIAIILGSGFGKLEDEVKNQKHILYQDIPNFCKTTVLGHSGYLIYGDLEDKKVLIMAGRFHYYEGNSMQEITFPIRVFKQLGIENLILSNAAGGVNPNFKVGDLMIIKDHINLFPEHPLRGKNLTPFGNRFVDMSCAYDQEFIQIAEKIAENNSILIHKGIYVGLQGPTFETPAEYDMIKNIGGDAVGMSTVPEVIVAKHQSMRCFAISIIADLGGSNIKMPVSHTEVLQNVDLVVPKVITIIKGILKEIKIECFEDIE